MSTKGSSDEPLRRQLSPLGLWLLAINGMIGAGIFGVAAEAERIAGVFSPWVFVVCSFLIGPIVLCFAQLSSAFSGTGGPVLYAQTAFGPFVGFQAGWAFYVARVTAFAANLNLLVDSIGHFWSAAADAGPRIGLLFALVCLMTGLNIVGADVAVRWLGALTMFKLLPLVGLATVGLTRIDHQLFEAALRVPPAADLGAAVLLVIYAFVGFESSVVPAGEAKNPRHDMPRALVWALGVAALLYTLVQVAARSLLPDLANAERPLVEAGEAWVGRPGAVIVMCGIVASVGGNLVGSMFTTPRITYRLGRDGSLPAWFAAVHPRFNTPAASVLFYGIAAFLLAASGSFVWLAVLSVLTRLLLYMTCMASMPGVRTAVPTAGALRSPGGRLIAAVAWLVCLGLLTQVSLASVLATAALLGVGTLLYGAATRGRRQRLA